MMSLCVAGLVIALFCYGRLGVGSGVVVALCVETMAIVTSFCRTIDGVLLRVTDKFNCSSDGF